jgi:hypothetical protein
MSALIMDEPPKTLPGYAAYAYPAGEFRVVSGANHGDAVTAADFAELGDGYRLTGTARPRRLMLNSDSQTPGIQTVAAASEVGAPGDRLALLSLLTMMSTQGESVEILLVRHEDSGEEYALPLSPIVPRLDYTLISAQNDPGEVRIADIVCVSFAAGTLITRAGGAQTPIEALKPGDIILTRDSGPQPVRWIGKATMRGQGSFAPVVISAGTLGNEGDLVVSPHHRIFIYQRGQRRLGSTAELLVQAKNLVDGDAVYRREVGYVDYYSLVFDRHEIIYAEGIAAESLMVNEATLRLIPATLAAEVKERFPGLSQSQHFGTEISGRLLDQAGRDTLFRKPRRD